MPSLQVYRNALGVEQSVLDGIAADVAAAGIAGVSWSRAENLKCLIVSATEVSKLATGAGIVLTNETASELAGRVRQELSGQPDAREIPPRLTLEKRPNNSVYFLRTQPSRELTAERQLAQRAVESWFGLTKPSGAWVDRTPHVAFCVRSRQDVMSRVLPIALGRIPTVRLSEIKVEITDKDN